MNGDDIRAAISAATPLGNPRLSEVEWDDVAVCLAIALHACLAIALHAASRPGPAPDAASGLTMAQEKCDHGSITDDGYCPTCGADFGNEPGVSGVTLATPAHPHDGYAYYGCKCVCCLNVRALLALAEARP